jgi:hypothetical protein
MLRQNQSVKDTIIENANYCCLSYNVTCKLYLLHFRIYTFLVLTVGQKMKQVFQKTFRLRVKPDWQPTCYEIHGDEQYIFRSFQAHEILQMFKFSIP